ncbi:unnamed protein product [Pleuronectes platessa]|uniref:Uncharacterized protein n=1 Tax=Pleuronectes platessa TaxID=8262 RepID=A0A9N7UG22_PLEPL|nr:unnamed protein product [Pleuronectes platessa]
MEGVWGMGKGCKRRRLFDAAAPTLNSLSSRQCRSAGDARSLLLTAPLRAAPTPCLTLAGSSTYHTTPNHPHQVPAHARIKTYYLRIARVAGGSSVGVALSASCSLSQGQFGQPMALTPLKQAVTANPPPSQSNPRQSWANPKLIQGHSQLGVSRRAMPGHRGHSGLPGYAMIQ